MEAIRRASDAYNRGDIDAVLEELDPEVEWHPLLQVLLGGEATVYRGHEGVRELYRDLDEAFTELQAEQSKFRDLGEQVVAMGHFRGRGRESGASTETAICLVGRVQTRQGGPDSRIPRPGRSPRSRRAAGVGIPRRA